MSSKKTQKQPKRRESIGSKIPSACENPDSFMGKHPAWKFARCDKEHAEWGFCHEQFDFEIMEKLESFESMTWAEILEASGGKSRGKGNNNHFIEIENLHKTARQRMEKLKIITDEVFSLRGWNFFHYLARPESRNLSKQALKLQTSTPAVIRRGLFCLLVVSILPRLPEFSSAAPGIRRAYIVFAPRDAVATGRKCRLRRL